MKPIYLQEDSTSRRFLYLQLYDTIKARILQGEMVCGEKLPSLRSAAADLASVSRLRSWRIISCLSRAISSASPKRATLWHRSRRLRCPRQAEMRGTCRADRCRTAWAHREINTPSMWRQATRSCGDKGKLKPGRPIAPRCAAIDAVCGPRRMGHRQRDPAA